MSSTSQGEPVLSSVPPHFQEEAKEEQTVMVPQAIPLRRCRFCMVLVGEAGASVGWVEGRLRLLGLTPPPGRPPRCET